MKRILHMDMDAFFASVEVARNPRLRGRPVVVGGEPGDPRSVVSSASYEARHFGVRSAMPIAEAHRLCPGAVFLRGDHELYGAVSRRIHTLLESVSPLVHMASIDEAYVDITGSLRLFGGEEALALGLKARIRGETGLPCTVAVAANKLVSKVAANEVKPDGCVSIPAGGEAAWLAPLPVGKLPGIGPRTREMLESLGILTVGALAAAPAPVLEPVFGAQNAHVLRAAALGVASDEVETGGAPKSISRETTFPEDLSDWALLGNVAAQLLEHCAHALREEGME
ncbi:MAG TPA: DNA polymerase IV, partial [Candidatus Hydrogenedentes bacterium]|nr:DNA polymerase IV [Candidatus Hydrogenedentota bacterium]